MNAIVSGQAGVALLLDGDTLSSLRAGHPGEVVRRSPGEVPLLFGDAKDLQFLEGVEPEEVGNRLERASEQMDAFHLALILLDESLESDTRKTAAEELEELLEIEENLRFVENILYAYPLPRGANLAGARAVCPGTANLIRRLLERLGSLQEVIAKVYSAWERIPENLFDGKRDRAYAQSIAVREGFFRDLVALCSAEKPAESFFAEALLNGPFRGVRNHREILHAWVALIRMEPNAQPQPVEADLQASTVAEAAAGAPLFWLAGHGTSAEPLTVSSRLVPREHGIPLDIRNLETQVSGFAARHPNLIQPGHLVRTMVESDDGTEWWWAFCILVQSQNRRVLEVFELIPPQSTEMGRTWFDLIETCCEIYSARWRRSDDEPVSQLQLGRAMRNVERLIDSVEVFMGEVIPSQLSSDQLRQLEHLLHDAKLSLRQQQQRMDDRTEYSVLELEKALWALHELLDRLGARLGLRSARLGHFGANSGQRIRGSEGPRG